LVDTLIVGGMAVDERRSALWVDRRSGRRSFAMRLDAQAGDDEHTVLYR
jgi:hypothetical protein